MPYLSQVIQSNYCYLSRLISREGFVDLVNGVGHVLETFHKEIVPEANEKF